MVVIKEAEMATLYTCCLSLSACYTKVASNTGRLQSDVTDNDYSVNGQLLI